MGPAEIFVGVVVILLCIFWTVFIYSLGAQRLLLCGETYRILYSYSNHPDKHVYVLRDKNDSVFLHERDEPFPENKKYIKLVSVGWFGQKSLCFNEPEELEQKN